MADVLRLWDSLLSQSLRVSKLISELRCTETQPACLHLCLKAGNLVREPILQVV